MFKQERFFYVNSLATANSCLRLGYIYEQQNDYPKAVYYYKKCMSYTNHEYKNSLAQKAKTGLKRIEERKVK
ncbi:MAG: hypothetical protein K1X81_01345 [Bacteroidia bacterium]|nr:hypothetical protein [Bacteroidia bacterium]